MLMHEILLEEAREEGLQVIRWGGKTIIRKDHKNAVEIDSAGEVTVKDIGRILNLEQSRKYLGIGQEQYA